MKNRMLWTVALTLVCFGSVLGQGVDPGVRDTLYVSSVQTDAGQKAVVDIVFANDERLGALTIPLHWSSPDITLDSVSFVGTRVAYLNNTLDTIYQSEQTVVIGAVVFFEAYIPIGRGLAARMYFDIPAGTPDQFVTIDSITKGPAYVMFTNTNSSNFVPVFEPGMIQIGDPPVPPHIVLSTGSMTFEGKVGFSSPPPQTLTISNTGGGSPAWTAESSAGWLSAVPASGTVPVTIGIYVDITGLDEGTYEADIEFACPDADNSPQYLDVTLNIVRLPPRIVNSPSNFSISAVQGGANPADRYLYISTDIPGSELNWTVSHLAPWLTLSPDAGAPPDSVCLTFDIFGLGYGNYYDTIVIADPQATNSPRRVPVRLQILSDLPIIALDPDTLQVVAQVGTNAAPALVYICNAGEGGMTFQVSETSDRITSVSPSSGPAPATVTFSFNTDQLASGSYYDTVWVSSPEAINSPQGLVVRFLIANNPADLYVVPTRMTINKYQCWDGPGQPDPYRYFQIENHGAGSFFWTATADSSWLVIERASGLGPYVNKITINGDHLPIGVYQDTVTVVALYALNSPRKIAVTLNVIPYGQPPSIVFEQSLVEIPAQEVFGTYLLEFVSIGELYNFYPGCMDYYIEEDIPWLKFIDSVGSGPVSLRGILDIGSYTWGTYTDSFYIHVDGASNSPVKVYLTLLVWRLHGDVDWSNAIDVGDVVYLVYHTFKFGPGPKPNFIVGDCNCDFLVDVGDIVYLVNYIFKSGNKPCGNL